MHCMGYYSQVMCPKHRVLHLVQSSMLSLLHTPSAHTLCSHPLHTPSAHTLCTHPLLTLSAHTLCTHPLHTPSAHTLRSPAQWNWGSCFLASHSAVQLRGTSGANTTGKGNSFLYSVIVTMCCREGAGTHPPRCPHEQPPPLLEQHITKAHHYPLVHVELHISKAANAGHDPTASHISPGPVEHAQCRSVV